MVNVCKVAVPFPKEINTGTSMQNEPFYHIFVAICLSKVLDNQNCMPDDFKMASCHNKRFMRNQSAGL